ncbi:MAG TPA: hypothetical protein DEA26_05155 [Oceanospirillales bacterium]|nr:hypothetical protein [Oceanospirillaceae bacterium]HBS42047.1 hypothetical protein [Oceanospirillales bacterium]|tara:strand:- start:2275 stop:5274 length:3000 start_codon:yes stop_codon:yes gene_type:complete
MSFRSYFTSGLSVGISERPLRQWVLWFSGLYLIFLTLSLILTLPPDSESLRWCGNMAAGVMLSRRPHKDWIVGLGLLALLHLILFGILDNREGFAAATLISDLTGTALIALLLKPQQKQIEEPENVSGYTQMLLIITVLPPVLSTLLQVSILYLSGHGQQAIVWMPWLISAITGCIIIFPLCLGILNQTPAGIYEVLKRRDSLITLLIAVATVIAAFPGNQYPFIFLSAVLILSALTTRCGISALTIFITSVMVILLTPLSSVSSSVAIHRDLTLYFPLMLTVLPATILSVAVYSARRSREQIRLTAEDHARLYERTPAIMHSIDSQGRLVAVSDAWLTLLGYSRDEVLGRKSTDFLSPESARRAREEVIPDFFRTGSIEKVPYQMVCRSGELIEVELSAIVEQGREKDSVRSLAVMKDVTHEVSLTRELERESELLETTLRSIGDGVIATDTAGRITFMNPRAEEITGFLSAEAEGRPFSEVVMLTSDGEDLPVTDPVQRIDTSNCGDSQADFATLRNREGRSYSIQDTISAIRSTDGSVLGTIMVFQDVTEARAVSEKMSYLAQHDALTTLPNRVLLMDRLQQACRKNQRSDHQFALIFLDLDHFKVINDSLGHDQGDILLREIARRLASNVRSSDTVCRLGGDEFVLILDDIREGRDISNFCQKLTQEISQPVTLKNRGYRVTPSIGVAVCPADGNDPDTLMRRADAAMYRSKNMGRSTFHFYSRGLEEEVENRLRTEQRMRTEIDENRFYNVYQPIVHTGQKDVIYAEALCRWRNSSGKEISPDDFIPVAEETGLIREIGRRVLRDACRAINAISDADHTFITISLNISPVQLATQGFAEDVKAILSEEGTEPEHFIFEITESAVMDNMASSIRVLEEIKELGILIALDDFGTGYSSLSYLKKLPIDIIKIDKEFVNDMTNEGQDRVFISAILSMARALQLEVIAEGVENAEQADILTEMGCRYLQGYHFSPPVAFDVMLQRFARRQTSLSQNLS